MFFEGKIPSRPDGDFLENIQKNWWGEYDRLEAHHGFIQWLFPLRTPGLNSRSQALQLHELEVFQNQKNKKNHWVGASFNICYFLFGKKYLRSSRSAKAKLLKSYQMMLDFYGMRLASLRTGEVERAENYRERYRNLKRFNNFNAKITGWSKLKHNVVLL